MALIILSPNCFPPITEINYHSAIFNLLDLNFQYVFYFNCYYFYK